MQPLPKSAVASIESKLLHGENVRSVCAKSGYSLGAVARIRRRLVHYGKLKGRDGSPPQRQTTRPARAFVAPNLGPGITLAMVMGSR